MEITSGNLIFIDFISMNYMIEQSIRDFEDEALGYSFMYHKPTHAILQLMTKSDLLHFSFHDFLNALNVVSPVINENSWDVIVMGSNPYIIDIPLNKSINISNQTFNIKTPEGARSNFDCFDLLMKLIPNYQIIEIVTEDPVFNYHLDDLKTIKGFRPADIHLIRDKNKRTSLNEAIDDFYWNDIRFAIWSSFANYYKRIHNIRDKTEINSKYVFLDTETTGLPLNWKAPASNLSNWPRAVQISWKTFDENEDLIKSENFIIKPEGFTIPYDAEKVHGISTARALEEGEPIDFVLDKLSKDIENCEYLIAHNLEFDQKIIESEAIRSQIRINISTKRGICTMKESTDYCAIPSRYGFKWPTLNELHYKLFNYNFEESHNAEFDVEACSRCFFELKDKKVISIK